MQKAKSFSEILANDQIIKREDLANFLNITHKYLNYVLYSRDRGVFYHEKNIKKVTRKGEKGKDRTLHAVLGELKYLQRQALDKFQSIQTYKPTSYSHGFTPGKSIITNAAYHRRSKLIIKVDLQDFFPNINFGRVQGMFMAQPFNFGREAATTMAQMACLPEGIGVSGKEGSLPQGGVLSPYISNMICRRLDKRLARLAQEEKYRCHFTRYADDITFSTNNAAKIDIEGFLKEVRGIVESEHFVLNKKKTKILTRKDRQIVTGVVVNDGLNVNRKYIRNLRATIRNCEKFKVVSQIIKYKSPKYNNSFRDNRNSRIVPNHGEDVVKYFLKHLLGKIRFFGDVVLSSGQEKQRAVDETRYQRIKTYEELLWRFYQLAEVKSSRDKKIQREVTEQAKKLIRKRPNLLSRLNQSEQAYNIRKSPLDNYLNEESTKQSRNKLKSLKTIEGLQDFIENKKKTDPRFFEIKLTSDINELRGRIDEFLSYPPISKKETEFLLQSFKMDGGLKNLVHPPVENNDWTVKDCYRVLNDEYEKIFYVLPKGLKKEIEEWKNGLGRIAKQHDEDYFVDVVSDPLLAKKTLQLKCNTRFGGSDDSTRIREKINQIVKKVNNPNIAVQIDEKFIKSLYTHVPSILESIERIVRSMVKHSPEYGVSVVKIESKIEGEIVEISIYDDSAMPAFNDLDNRDCFHGTLTGVISLTNGLCDYVIEASLVDGSRIGLDMHNETNLPPTKDRGFVHLLRFPKIT